MNTGHDGSLSTGHANSPQDMLSRLETMALFASDIPIQAIRKQIACLYAGDVVSSSASGIRQAIYFEDGRRTIC